MERKRCGIMFKQIDTLLAKRANASLKANGVTFSQVELLQTIRQSPEGELPFKQIERELKVSQPTVAGLIARLRDKDLVETYASPTSPNAKIARLTPAGEATCERTRADMEREDGNLFAGFTDAERASFETMLARVVANLSG